jgi:hypothetical protein
MRGWLTLNLTLHWLRFPPFQAGEFLTVLTAITQQALCQTKGSLDKVMGCGFKIRLEWVCPKISTKIILRMELANGALK